MENYLPSSIPSTAFSRRRRRVVLGLTLSTVSSAWAGQNPSLNNPLRLGVDHALMASGLARALQRSFGQDTGVAVTLNGGGATQLLEAAELGDQDAVLSNAPWLEAQLEKQGLVHDRRHIASGSFVLVGPTVLAKALDAKRDVVLALQRLAQVKAPFVSHPLGSGTQLAEQALWRTAQVTPDKEWHQIAATSSLSDLMTQARSQQACALVELGAWLAHGGTSGYSVLVESDTRLDVPVHVMRSFRGNHPAGKLFVNWIAGPKGRSVVSGVRGYRGAA